MRFLGFRDEKIHSQALGKELRDELPLNAVSGAVQRRGESSQSALPRRDGDDPTTDSALATRRSPFRLEPGGIRYSDLLALHANPGTDARPPASPAAAHAPRAAMRQRRRAQLSIAAVRW